MAYVKIGLIGKLDMLKFKNITKVRENEIQASPATPLPKVLTTNEKAKKHHPAKQDVVIADIRQNGADAKTIVFKTPDGSRLALYRAGQYVSVSVPIGDTVTTRSYSLCSSPELAKKGEYHITVKRDDAGFVSPYIQDNWKVGQAVTISGPQGHLYYEPLRDAKKVIALAGGSGITPFMGMAYAIRDGHEDFDLTIIFGSRTAEGIVYKKELDEVCAACDKVHVVHVLSDEEKEGYEHGFITAELIKKYAGEGEYSIFMCGPQAMYNFLDGEIAKLGLRRKFVRREMFGAIKDPWNQPGYPAEAKGKKFKLKVIKYGEEFEVEALADEPLLVAIERAGISAPSRCRSGECGWCRSKLVSGKVFIPEKTDGRRAADVDYNYVHPCASFPLSDIVIEVSGSNI
ncbi:MAG: iron-sulfur cluster-binding domain-containing protein [Oscillospiraceae bacterium]|nr:iron-sulfur cluster-binding domain-containing protein [Oscillospiraceae bacterium]